MAQKNTVEYFPHFIADGKKMEILEEQFGNDGYATWFKILERLAKTDHHFLNLKDPISSLWLSTKCKVKEQTLLEVIQLLVRLEVFDPILWQEYRIIYCQKFNESIQDVYRKRSNRCSDFADIMAFTQGHDIDTTKKPPTPQTPKKAEEPQVKAEELDVPLEIGGSPTRTKLNYTKLNQTSVETPIPESSIIDFPLEKIKEDFRRAIFSEGMAPDALGDPNELADRFHNHYSAQNWVRGNGQRIHRPEFLVKEWVKSEKLKAAKGQTSTRKFDL